VQKLSRALNFGSEKRIRQTGETGVYYDDEGRPMLGSSLVRDPKFTARVVAETRALLATVPNEMGEGSIVMDLVEHGKRS
jgi:hypothetical protein